MAIRFDNVSDFSVTVSLKRFIGLSFRGVAVLGHRVLGADDTGIGGVIATSLRGDGGCGTKCDDGP